MSATSAAPLFGNWAEIVEKIQNGEAAAVEDLYSALSGLTRAGFVRRVDPQQAEDRLHEVLVIVLQTIRAGGLRDPSRLMGFVRTVMRRRVAAYIRAAIEGRHLVSFDVIEPATRTEASPEERTAHREQVRAVHKAMRGLRARDREILLRFYYLEQSPSRICAEMGLTSTQFRLYKSRALARCSEIANRKRTVRVSPPSRFESRTG